MFLYLHCFSQGNTEDTLIWCDMCYVPSVISSTSLGDEFEFVNVEGCSHTPPPTRLCEEVAEGDRKHLSPSESNSLCTAASRRLVRLVWTVVVEGEMPSCHTVSLPRMLCLYQTPSPSLCLLLIVFPFTPSHLPPRSPFFSPSSLRTPALLLCLLTLLKRF